LKLGYLAYKTTNQSKKIC